MSRNLSSLVRRRGAIALCIVTAAVCVAIACLRALNNVGGVSSRYHATDHDAMLTEIAGEAIPIIAAIDRFYQTHGHCPAANETDLVALRASLPAEVTAIARNNHVDFHHAPSIAVWSYYSNGKDPTMCELSRKLGWDPDLIWRRRASAIKWVFAPGDGGEETIIDLEVR